MTPCARGCTHNGHHKPECGCTPTCPNHKPHCYGCQPQQAETGQLCHTCTNHIREALNEIPNLTARLHRRGGHIDNHNQQTHIHTTHSYRTPSPAFDLADDTCRLIWSWVDTTCDQTNTLGPPRYNITGIPDPYQSIAHLCRWLKEHLTWATQNQPKDIHDELTQQHRRLQRALSLDEHIERIPEPCPSCGTGRLTREDGSENVCCGNPVCNRVWRQAEWLARVGAHA